MAVGPFEANCYLIWSQAHETLVLDPGADAEIILDVLDNHHLSVAGYLVSHGHVDHISALAALGEKHPAPLFIHSRDYQWAFSASNQMPPFYPVPRKPTAIPRFIDHYPKWAGADLSCDILSTPGHSPGSVCFYFRDEAVLFSGDTLFQGTVGRTDLPGGNGLLLSRSLQTLAQLPHTTRIYPGHGSVTSLKEELRINPLLKK